MASKEDKWLNLPMYCSCTHSRDNVYEYPELNAMLPVHYNYTVCDWYRENEEYFECRFRVNVSTKAGALAWLEDFKHSSNTYYTTDKTFPEDTQNLLYKVIMKCYRNTRPKYSVKKAHPQHTNCQARLTITVKRTEKSKKYQSKDVHLKDFPMVILYRHKHNHEYNPVKALQKHSINPEVSDVFVKFFEEGFAPPKAIELYIDHLKEKYGDEYPKALEDEKIFPTKHAVYHLFYKAFRTDYRKSKRKQMFQSLESHITKFNAEMKGRFSELRVFGDENFVVVIVSPLMKRVLLNIPETSDVLFMDSFDNADNYGSKVIMFLTKSCYGALPVGSVILSVYREDILSYAFDVFKSFLDNNCFVGRGLLGPKVIVVKNNPLVKTCIRKAFPGALVVLNTCIVLRDLWKYLVKSNIHPLRRMQELLFKVKEMLYCSSEVQLSSLYDNLKSSSLATEFPDYLSYVEKLYAQKEDWANCFSHSLVFADEHVKSLCEQRLDIVEDNIFQMKKLYFAVNLFDYIVSDVDQFYRNKLIYLIGDQNLTDETKETFVDEGNYTGHQLVKYGAKSFKVRSFRGKRDYFVELDIGVCNCRIGKNGANCEHQAFALMKYRDQSITSVSVDLEQKAVLLYIATGQTDSLNSYVANLCDIEDEENLERASEVIILEPHASAFLEFFEDVEEDLNTESVSENIFSTEKDKIVTIKEFQECVKSITNQAETNPETFLAVKQFVTNFKKLKAENSLVLSMNCFFKNSENSKDYSASVSNNCESTVYSNISVKRYFAEANSCNDHSTSKLEPCKKSKTTTPFVVRVSHENVTS